MSCSDRRKQMERKTSSGAVSRWHRVSSGARSTTPHGTESGHTHCSGWPQWLALFARLHTPHNAKARHTEHVWRALDAKGTKQLAQLSAGVLSHSVGGANIKPSAGLLPAPGGPSDSNPPKNIFFIQSRRKAVKDRPEVAVTASHAAGQSICVIEHPILTPDASSS